MADLAPPPTALTHNADTATTDSFVARLTHAPALPDGLRKAHGAFIGTDSRFAAAARVLASLWRSDRDLPAGVHLTRTPGGKTRRIRAGYLLRADAARAGAAFLEPATTTFVRRALVLREPGSAWDVAKMQGHLLSSQGLLLNFFVPLACNRDLATAVFRRLLPDFVHRVTGIQFETSPGRDDPSYLGDGTAFDARLDVVTPGGEPAFVAIELKYIEALAGPAASPRARYPEVARASGLFVDPAAPALYRPGLEQLRREHTLAHLMLARGLASRAHFVLLGPALSPRVRAAAQAYSPHLVDPGGAAGGVGFSHLTLEAVLGALAAAGATDTAQALYTRYLDLDRVAALALTAEPTLPSPPPPASPAAPRRLPPPPHAAKTAPIPTAPAPLSRPRQRPTQGRRSTMTAPHRSATASQPARAPTARHRRPHTAPSSVTRPRPRGPARAASSKGY